MTGSTTRQRLITPDLLRDLATCERRAWLNTHEADPPANARYTVARLDRPDGGAIKEAIATTEWADAVRATEELMDQRAPAILGACLEIETPLDLSDHVYTIRAQVDRLVRVQHLGEPIYSPALVRPATTPDDGDRLALDLCVWLLAALEGTPPPAELWLGAEPWGSARRRIPHDYDEDRLMQALAQAASVLTDSTPPPVRVIDACKGCVWQTACNAEAHRVGTLELLYGVSKRVRAGLRDAGLSSLAAVANATPDELRAVKGIGPATAHVIRANAQAWIEARPVHFAPLAAACAEDGWMFDLETLERNGQTVPWCMGWCDPAGRTEIALVAPVQTPERLTLPDGQPVTLVPDSDGAWEVFAEAAIGDAPVFHWTGYDAAILRGTAPEPVRAALEPRMHDFHRSLTRAVSLPLRSTSIKAVSIYLGFSWPGYNDWFAAYLDYRYWLDGGGIEALQKACMYQRADVQSMAWVWRWLNGVESSAQA